MITIRDSFGIEPTLNMEQVWNTVKTFMQQGPQYKYGTNHQDIWNTGKTSLQQTSVAILIYRVTAEINSFKHYFSWYSVY